MRKIVSLLLAMAVGLMAEGSVLALVCTDPAPGLVSWWPGEGNANDTVGTSPGTVRGGATFVPGKVGQAFGLNGVDAFVEIPDACSLKPSTLTVEAWVRFDSLDTPLAASPGLQFIVFKKNTRSFAFEGYTLAKARIGGADRFLFVITSATGVQIAPTSLTVVASGQFYHVAGTYDGTTAKLYVNGFLEDARPAGFALNYDTTPLFIGTSGEPIFDGKLQGVVDEVSLYNRALSDAEIGAIVAADSAGKCIPISASACQTALAQANQTIQNLQAQVSQLQSQLGQAQQQNTQQQNQIAQLNVMLASLQNQVAILTAKNTQLQNNLNQVNTAVETGLARIQSDFRTVFENPNFVIPGGGYLQQYQNLINAILGLNEGRKRGIYRNLVGRRKPRAEHHGSDDD